MKRFWAVILSLSLLFSLAACGKQAEPPSPTPEQTSSPSPAPTESNPPPVSPAPSVSVEPSPEPEPDVSEAPFVFTRENFPILNGSTSTAPLGQAVAAALLGETEDEVSDLINFSRTTNSFRALMAGKADLLIVGEPNAAVFDEMAAAGFAYTIDTFATDGLIFVVNEDNPVDNLTTQQIRDIYSGKITNWSQVGGEDLPITPFQRNEDAGSQALMKKLVMRDTELMNPPAHYVVESMMGLMEAVRSYDNSPGAIGYSVYYYANDMQMASGLKILSVDGVAPSAETIRSEEYPHRNAYYVVMAADTPEDAPAARVFRWILSEEGQTLVAEQGYVSVLDLPSPSEEGFTTIANRISDGPLSDLIPSADYGTIVPYIGSEMYTIYPYEEQIDPYPTYLYGLCTADGTILTDPVYNGIAQLSWYDSSSGAAYEVPVWCLTRTEVDENGEYYTAAGLAALDGSWYTGMIYRTGFNFAVHTTSQSILMRLDAHTAVMIGLDGRELFRWTVDDFLPADHYAYDWFFTDGLNWTLRNAGDRLLYRPVDYELEGAPYIWLDPLTGEVLEELAEDPLAEGFDYNACPFDGGWCKLNGLALEIHYDDGREKTLYLPVGVQSWYTATDEYFKMNFEDGTTRIYDHSGQLILEGPQEVSANLTRDTITGREHLFLQQYVYKKTEEYDRIVTTRYTLINGDGSKKASFESQLTWLTIYNGLLSVVDDVSYRLVDVETMEDVIRLPRLNNMDHPTE